ncbi:hypothetical protein [Aggregatilinea lenta]|uniref:hypothetical protein n=1 Tax=Aggregatilinea lenta TaxID=913108 RepID=UPI000E5BB080|nr:hypothetical protein [Aggregatilinea lenta]
MNDDIEILDPELDDGPDHRGVIAAALIMAAVGWIGLWILVASTLPTSLPRWTFFVLLYVATTGTVLPFVRFLNMRFVRDDGVSPAGGVLLRQSIWIGLFVVACAWLQMPRVLNPVIAFFLAFSLVLIEFFLRIRERSGDSE